ncbi:hypothetical protein P5673_009187 [Acropora cervicornis]|uniref:Uncharacterized protein n=1 Tax=Acropora cervicornis TaxID=6130 RepID=A0AAD9QSI7_ACRCE|nr:hypothetical protein P5673_009187 [Acropora cervicornis]
MVCYVTWPFARREAEVGLVILSNENHIMTFSSVEIQRLLNPYRSVCQERQCVNKRQVQALSSCGYTQVEKKERPMPLSKRASNADLSSVQGFHNRFKPLTNCSDKRKMCIT